MKIGICFSGGGIKGACHIGVLKALEEENIKFDFISGTSSGSIIAILYALGFTSNEMYEIFKKYSKKINYFEFKNILKLIYGIIVKRKIIIKGLNSGEKIEKLVKQECNKKGIKNINQIKKKLFIPSVNLINGKMIVFSSYQNRATYSDKIVYNHDIDVGKAIRASCSYPGIFEPTQYQNEYLIDGGIRENVPWKILKENGADKVISIVFQNELVKKEKINIFDSISGSLELLCHELSNYELEGADYLLKIKTKDISLLDRSKINYLYQLGYIETKGKIREIKNNVYKF